MFTSRARLHPLVLMLVCVAGCGGGPEMPATVPASGTVTLKGAPCPKGATITLIPVNGGRPAIGTTDDQGRFVLSTFGQQDGAVPGDHYVGLALVEVTGDAQSDPYGGVPSDEELAKLKTKRLIPEQLGVPEQSGIQVTIPDDGTDSLEIPVD
ncbi:MAG: hypothetical protein R3B90_01565 [Planctomycetaceae bacterium]